MKNKIKTLVLVAVMTGGISLALPTEADAQYGYGGYGHGYGYGGYGHGYGYGHGFGGYGYGYGGYGPYGYGYSNGYSNDGAVRIEVNPKESRKEIEVYVDGGQAGVVNDFDGAFQRLYLSPGKHDVELRLEGYETMEMAIFVSLGKTTHIRGQMEPLA